ncbi:TetR/AcrR family transcriptional regulator [Natranaeroarchaeum aerophilus]|uniref:TetR/AcrR family transcriptional regulator n=1 Tax=Natranaeroarchaeum aerophilus TaxID=2917711 RepID=A0AAE3K744_9EURY|nr:TetR/AcrR family transcriptional regulator [Natranaeroarchaeum aerophilus]MCL9813479.1 TetR/AcrR family transcriptional regulator [Natranaeroarchaeum aerophilus]
MSEDPFADTETTQEEILAATYRALCTEGYADITIKSIGEQFEKSPSLIYRHYEGKDDLVRSCLEYLLEGFESQHTSGEFEKPREELDEFVTSMTATDLDDEERQFMATLVALRARGVTDEEYRQLFTRSDAILKSHLVSIIESGIDTGEFQQCTPESVAETLLAILSGVSTRQATSMSDEWVTGVRSEVNEYLKLRVYAE